VIGEHLDQRAAGEVLRPTAAMAAPTRCSSSPTLTAPATR